MDEAGRGPVIGPLVIGLVAVTEEELQELIELGVDDSKSLSGKRREHLFDQIKSISSVAEVLVVDAQELNEMMETYTLNEIEVMKFRELLAPVSKKIKTLFLDAADVNAERFGNRFADLVPYVVSEHKADSNYEVVAAASILAKTVRDRQISELQELYKKKFPDLPPFGKGYPANAKKFLEAYYNKYLEIPEIARTKWKTVKRIIENSPQRNLDEFM